MCEGHFPGAEQYQRRLSVGLGHQVCRSPANATAGTVNTSQAEESPTLRQWTRRTSRQHHHGPFPRPGQPAGDAGEPGAFSFVCLSAADTSEQNVQRPDSPLWLSAPFAHPLLFTYERKKRKRGPKLSMWQRWSLRSVVGGFHAAVLAVSGLEYAEHPDRHKDVR